MSHTSRRGPPVECPLASLGRNTPTLDTQTYHHPLSSSPLDPQVYQMSRNSPILNTDVIIYSSSRNNNQSNNNQNNNNNNNQNNNNQNNNNNHQVNSSSNSDRDQKTTISSVSDSQIYHLSRSSSSSMDQSSSYAMRRDLEPRVYRPPPPREYTPAMHIESLLSYHERLSPVSVERNNPNNYLLDDIKDNTTETSSVVVVNHNDRYYLEEKMDSLYYQGAIRNLPTMRQQKNSHMNTERYYLEKEDMDNICHYPSSNRMDDESPNLLRRPSSPSETSGSDRYLIDGMRSSPAIMAKGRRTQIQIHDNRYLQQHNGVNDQR